MAVSARYPVVYVYDVNGALKDYRFTRHIWRRMQERRIPLRQVKAVLAYGSSRQSCSGVIREVRRREVERCALGGIALSGLEGIRVVHTLEGRVITVYRQCHEL